MHVRTFLLEDSSVAVVPLDGKSVVRTLSEWTGSYAMLANAEGAAAFVANSDADSVSVIDTATDRRSSALTCGWRKMPCPAQVRRAGA